MRRVLFVRADLARRELALNMELLFCVRVRLSCPSKGPPLIGPSHNALYWPTSAIGVLCGVNLIPPDNLFQVPGIERASTFVETLCFGPALGSGVGFDQPDFRGSIPRRSTTNRDIHHLKLVLVG